MKKVRVTIKRIAHYEDLMEQYENPIEHACSMRLGFDKDKIIIATNGFVKKKQKTPRSEIELAKHRRADYHSRKEEQNG